MEDKEILKTIEPNPKPIRLFFFAEASYLFTGKFRVFMKNLVK